QLIARKFLNNGIWNRLVPFFIVLDTEILILCREIFTQPVLREYYTYRLISIRIEGVDLNIRNFCADDEGSIRRQCPGCCGPGKDIRSSVFSIPKEEFRLLGPDHLELCHGRR